MTRILLFLVIAASLAACGAGSGPVLPDGIYLVADKNMGEATIRLNFWDTAKGGMDLYRKPLLAEQTFEHIYASISNSPGGTYTIVFTDTGTDEERLLLEAFHGRKIVLVIDGLAVADIVFDYYVGWIAVDARMPRSVSDPLVEKLDKRLVLQDSLARRRPADGPFSAFHSDGQLALEEEYKNGQLQWSKTYNYLTGKLETHRCPTCPGKVDTVQYAGWLKHYAITGDLDSVRYYSANHKGFSRTYTEKGQVRSEFYTYGIDLKTAMEERSPADTGFYYWVRYYDEKGRLSLLLETRYLDPPQMDFRYSQYGFPQKLVREKRYAGGQLQSEGMLYYDANRESGDSVEVWQFYAKGLLVRTVPFISWRKFDNDRRLAIRNAPPYYPP